MKEKSTRKTSIISEIGLRDRKYLLFVGGLNKKEGAHYLIEAFKQLEDTAKTPNNFKLVIVANGKDDDDQDYVKYLCTISQKRDNVIFFCARKKSTIKELISKAYLFVRPCESKIDNTMLLEVMKNGLAPLVSDVKENLEMVGDDGFVFRLKSVIDLRDRLAYLLNRKDEVEAMGKFSKEKAQKYFKKIAILKEKKIKQEKIISQEHKSIWSLKKFLKRSH